MVNKITTPPTQNEVIDKINEVIDGKQDTLVSGTNIKTVGGTSLLGSGNVAFPTVDQTYSATSTNAQSGVAVASAIGNGTVTINQGGTARGTFTMNQSSNLTIDLDGTSGVSAVAVLNKNTASPYLTLGIWQGTEYQWNHDIKIWYFWKTPYTVTFTTGGELPYAYIWRNPAYGDGNFVSVCNNTNYATYSTDGGATWNSATLPEISTWVQPVYGDGNFVVISIGLNVTAYSTDGGVTWQRGGALPSSTSWWPPAYGDGRFVTIDRGTNSAYSTNGGVTWQSGGALPSGNWQPPAYGNGAFVTVSTGYSKSAAYSTDGGVTWNSATLPSNGNWEPPAYENGKFVVGGYNCFAYSTDGGATWHSTALPSGGYWHTPVYGDGKFVAVRTNVNYATYSTDGGITWSNNITLPSATWARPIYGNGVFITTPSAQNIALYSTDGGATWNSATLPSSGYWQTPAYGDGKFVTMRQQSTDSAIFTVQYDKCYTDTASPTTTSVVYSEPAVTSSYTISSVTSGAITLSNNNTYYYNQSGNTQTYQTIGDAHPEYLCFIDGVGVKMGNTMIATNNSNS